MLRKNIPQKHESEENELKEADMRVKVSDHVP